MKTAIAVTSESGGRIVSAAGYAGVPFNPAKVDLSLNGFLLYRAGTPVSHDGAKVSSSIKENRETAIELAFQEGPAATRFWTTDLTAEYVRLNADYHTDDSWLSFRVFVSFAVMPSCCLTNLPAPDTKTRLTGRRHSMFAQTDLLTWFRENGLSLAAAFPETARRGRLPFAPRPAGPRANWTMKKKRKKKKTMMTRMTTTIWTTTI